jgi:four helix bundle protein
MEKDLGGTGVVSCYRDLRVWKGAMDLTESVYTLTRRFPKEETYGLTSQMRCAAVSLPSNIAEGHARESRKEYLHFLSVTQGSLAELETQAELGLRLGYMTSEGYSELGRNLETLGRQLRRLRQRLRDPSP